MKRIFVIILALTLCLCLMLSVSAADTSYVTDDADILTPSEEQELESLTSKLSKELAFDIVILTTTDTTGSRIDNFGEAFYTENDFREDGIILVRLAGADPYWSYVVFGEGNDIFDNDDCFEELEDAFVSDLMIHNYLKAFTNFANKVEEIVKDDRAFPIGTVVLSIIIGVLLTLLVPMSILKGELKSVKMQAAASNYVCPGSMHLTQDRDMFLYRNVTRTAKPKNTGSGGNTHRTSGGNTSRIGRG